MRVLHIIPSMAVTTGGPAIVVAELVAALLEKGVYSEVCTTDAKTPVQAQSPLAKATMHDFPVGSESLTIQIHPMRHPYRICYSPDLLRSLQHQVGSFDLLHIHSLNLYPQYAAWKTAIRHGIPYIVTPHGALDPWVRGRRRLLKVTNDLLWQRKMLDSASVIHLTTEEEARLIEPMNIKATKAVIPNGIRIEDFSGPANPDDFRRRWLGGYRGPLVLNHGRLSEKKGLDLLVRAIAEVQHSTPIHLALVGADEEGVGARLVQQSKQLGISELITKVPNLPKRELIHAIAAADIWVLPSHSENFGLAVTEAMVAGRPVITSPHVNIAPEAADADALMIAENSSQSIAAAINFLMANPERRAVLSRNAAHYAMRYNWSNVTQQFGDLYRNTIRENRT